MTAFDPNSFDFAAFERELPGLIAAELRYQANRLRKHSLRGLALDCQPWHGILDLAVLTEEDEAGKWEIGDWEHYPLTDEEDEAAPWSATRAWAERTRTYWKAAVAGDAHDRAAEAADRLLRSCATALASPEVRAALSTLRLADDFELYVGNADDAESKNYCGG